MRLDTPIIANLARPIRPYSQGDLDGMCSLYAVINSIRWCIKDQPLAQKGPQWRDLFTALNDYAIKELGCLTFASTGLGLNSMIWLIRSAQDYMHEVHKIDIHTHRPFANNKPTQLDQVSQTTQNHISQEHSSALFAVYGQMNHWTVVTEITAKRVKTFDSDRTSYIPIRSLHPSDFIHKSQRNSHIQSASLICFSTHKKTEV